MTADSNITPITSARPLVSITSLELQSRILQALRHGARDHFQVAADLTQAPFRVRAELKALKRQRLVREQFDYAGNRVVWELRASGWAVVYGADQTTIVADMGGQL